MAKRPTACAQDHTYRFGLKRILFFVIFYTFSVSVDVVMFHWFMFQRGYHFGSPVWVSVRNHVLGVTMASTVKHQFGRAKIFLVHTHTHTPVVTVECRCESSLKRTTTCIKSIDRIEPTLPPLSPHALIYFIFGKKKLARHRDGRSRHRGVLNL